MRLLVALVLAVALLAGCGSGAPAEKEEEKAGGDETAVTQAPSEDKEKAAAEVKNKTPTDWAQPSFEVRDVRPGSITSPDLAFGRADVFLFDFGGRPYGIMKWDPVLQEIANEIRADNPEYEMMLVSVYSGTEKREDRFMSNWYAFESPAVEQEFLADFENYADEIVQDFKDKQAQQEVKK